MTNGPKRIPIVKEELSVNVARKLTGHVRVSTKTHYVEEMATALLEHEDVKVTRVPIGVEVAQAPEIRVEGNTTIVPVMEEVLVIEKRLVLREEIHIIRSFTSQNLEIPVTVRKQDAIVEREENNNQNP